MAAGYPRPASPHVGRPLALSRTRATPTCALLLLSAARCTHLESPTPSRLLTTFHDYSTLLLQGPPAMTPIECGWASRHSPAHRLPTRHLRSARRRWGSPVLAPPLIRRPPRSTGPRGLRYAVQSHTQHYAFLRLYIRFALYSLLSGSDLSARGHGSRIRLRLCFIPLFMRAAVHLDTWFGRAGVEPVRRRRVR